VLQWCDFVSTGVYQAYLDLHIHTLGAPDRRVAWIVDAATQKIDRLFTVMDQVLAQRPHLAGDLSIADLAGAAVLHTIKRRIPTDLTSARSHLNAWYARITSRPAWQRAVEEIIGSSN
jgi:glutathione S-transferase